MHAPPDVAPRGYAAPAEPVELRERLDALDVLRGLALLGMILVHFHQKMGLPVTGAEDLIGWVVWVGVEQKSWGTFAFLFGVGFAVLLRRLDARHTPVVPFYLRRLAGLAAFGLVAELCFGFHVLLEYAIWGVPLLLVRRWSTRRLLLLAGVAASIHPLGAAVDSLHAWWTLGPDGAAAAAQAAGREGEALGQARHAAELQASYLALLRARAASLRWNLAQPGYWVPDVNLTLFIIGLLALRHGVFDAPRRHVRLIVGWMSFGVVSWAVAWLLLRRVPELPVPGLQWPLSYGLGLVQDQWLCFTYIGAVVLLLAFRPAWRARLAPVGLAGRMALTNYMLQAAALDVLVSGYGLGLRVRPLLYVPATALLFGAEVALSRWWLAHYAFGPLEWVWRSATYGRAQPMQRVNRTPSPTVLTPRPRPRS